MKHILLFILSLLPMLASAEAVEINGIWYNLISKGKIAEVTFNPNESSYYTDVVTIPESITYEDATYTVTGIGESAFNYCTALTSVILPEGVTTIGARAFENCSSLVSISIPSTLNRIMSSAFSGCTSLAKVIVADIAAWCGIIYDSSMYNGFPLYYAKHLYSDEDSEITEVVIPMGVKRIEPLAFRDAKYITSVTIPNSVTYIGREAFRGMHRLTSINIPNGIESLEPYVFQDCEALPSISIPKSVTTVREHVFQKCYALASVTIPESVTSIGNCAFKDCYNLLSVYIGSCVTSIEEETFSGCTSLTSITIPNSVTSIEKSAFSGCTCLTSITIPNSVTGIGRYAFSGCTGLTSITIPNNVTSIGGSALSGCTCLTTITIGSNVTDIGDQAFANCPELTDVYCYLEKPTIYPDEESGTALNAFDGSYIEHASLHVPKASLETYRATLPWCNFGNIVSIEDGEEPEVKVCAKPTISYSNGKLSFSCETPGATCVSSISDTDINMHYGNEVSLTVTYNISVYATAPGYEDSNVATATLCWIDAEPNSEGLTDEDAVTEVTALSVLIQSQGGIVTIQGAPEGTPIAIYGTDGKDYGSAVAAKDRTTIATSLHRGSVAIIMIGEKAVKVAIR